MKKIKLYIALAISAMMVFNSSFTTIAAAVSENTIVEDAGEKVVTEQEGVSANEIVDKKPKDLQKVSEDVESDRAGKSFLAATAINVNTAVSDSIGYTGEDNYYKFSLSTPGYVKITFSHPLYDCVSGDSDWWIELYDANQETIYGFLADDGYTSNTYSPEIGLPAGTYYVCIEDFYSSDDVRMMKYNFRVDFHGGSSWEKEFNDGWLSATKIMPNTNVYGSLMQSYDNDYYVFYNNEPRCINISFAHSLFESEITGWQIELYDAAHDRIQYFEASDGYSSSKKGTNLYLSAGTYYILVDLYLDSDYHRDTTYTLRVNTQPNLGTVVTYNGIKYKVSKNGTSCYMQCIGPVNKKLTKATIESTIRINGFKYPICQIKSNAFKNCKKLKKIVIGTQMKTIGAKAFYGCKKLSSITIQSKRIQTIKSKAFKGIYKKAKFNVPNSKIKKYRKMLRKAGAKSTIKVK